jgi:hypothetical protein
MPHSGEVIGFVLRVELRISGAVVVRGVLPVGAPGARQVMASRRGYGQAQPGSSRPRRLWVALRPVARPAVTCRPSPLRRHRPTPDGEPSKAKPAYQDQQPLSRQCRRFHLTAYRGLPTRARTSSCGQRETADLRLGWPSTRRCAGSNIPNPGPAESALIAQLDLPLNLDQNRHHPFHEYLSDLRASARSRARGLPPVAPAPRRVAHQAPRSAAGTQPAPAPAPQQRPHRHEGLWALRPSS